MPDRKWWQLWSRQEEPEPVATAPQDPWETWDLPPVEDRDPNRDYGPHPDSPEAIEAARVLNERAAERLNLQVVEAAEEERPKIGDECIVPPLVTLPAYEQLLRVRNLPEPEPARLYVLRRIHQRTGHAMMKTRTSEWTDDLLQAELVFAAAAKVPEDDDLRDKTKTVHFRYELTPVDAILWAIHSAAETEQVESVYLG